MTEVTDSPPDQNPFEFGSDPCSDRLKNEHLRANEISRSQKLQ